MSSAATLKRAGNSSIDLSHAASHQCCTYWLLTALRILGGHNLALFFFWNPQEGSRVQVHRGSMRMVCRGLSGNHVVSLMPIFLPLEDLKDSILLSSALFTNLCPTFLMPCSPDQSVPNGSEAGACQVQGRPRCFGLITHRGLATIKCSLSH